MNPITNRQLVADEDIQRPLPAAADSRPPCARDEPAVDPPKFMCHGFEGEYRRPEGFVRASVSALDLIDLKDFDRVTSSEAERAAEYGRITQAEFADMLKSPRAQAAMDATLMNRPEYNATTDMIAREIEADLWRFMRGEPSIVGDVLSGK